MDVQNAHQRAYVVEKCPHENQRRGCHDHEPPKPRLMRIAEVERTCNPASPLGAIVEWVHSFLARPHPHLGRHGSVCPFVPVALGLNTIWMAEVAETTPSLERVSAIITEYRDVFLQTEPTRGPDALNKAFLVIFPALTADGADGAAIIDKIQASLKRYFVQMGLMLGEFHSKNESPGLRNPNFRPLRSPIPMLAIRHMVESDLPFLIRETYSPEQRSSFLRSYLFRLGGVLSQERFNEALAGLIAAEKAMASAA